jgi:phage tail-like protein
VTAVPARDANDATWYVLRYPEDFAPRAGAKNEPAAPFGAPSSPYLSPSLLFDAARGVLELLPEPPASPADSPPGVAIEPGGDIYRVDDHGELVVIRCDGSSAPLVCEPGVLAQPAGLALDRRGLLYVADPAAHRVVVLTPIDAHVVAILAGSESTGPLIEPVDVAVSPSGRVYVADREGGKIAIFSGAMRPLGVFETAAMPGGKARPIAVMVDADETVLVADAELPRLLRYSPAGERLADVELTSLTAPLAGGDLARGALERAYGDRMPRFLIGACGPCAPSNDAGARLSEVHRALRLLSLGLGRRFTQTGCFVSAALDGGRLGVPWHHIDVELSDEPPPGTSVTVETFTSDSPTPKTAEWKAPVDRNGRLVPFLLSRPEQLVQSGRGRYLWVKVTLSTQDGAGTPSVRAVRAYYPRVSWLDLLPSAYRRDPESAVFLERFLSLFEHVFTGVENRYEEFSRELNPDAAPPEVLDWLAALVDLSFDPSWPAARRRALLGAAMELYRTRGTIAGIERYVEIYTGIKPVIAEGFLERPGSPAYLGRAGSVVGCGWALVGPGASAGATPDTALWERFAHRFTVYVYLDDACDRDVMLRAVDRIVEVNKPAHTVHQLEAIYPDARVGVQSRVGLDFVLGAAEAPDLRVGGRSDEGGSSGAEAARDGAPGSVLGVDSVLGAQRPGGSRGLGEEL